MPGPHADLRAIFCEAIDRKTPWERADYLDQACRGRPELRAHVEELLEAHGEAGSFLHEPAGEPVVTFVTVDHPSLGEGPGTVIGPYKLLEQIGEGGFGVVYLAEQTEPVRRRVALKVLKPGMDTKQVTA